MEETSGKISAARASIPLGELGLEGIAPLTLHAVNLGANIKIVGLAAEPVYEYAAILEELYKGACIIPVGCIDHVFGYLPTAEMLPEGGYEADGFLRWFGLSGCFTPGFQQVVISRLAEL